jgi:hypothetical protein
MSLRPRFSSSPSAASPRDTANQEHNTIKDHRRLIYTPRYYRLFILFLILFASFYFFAGVFTNLNPEQDDSAPAASFARHARVLRGILGVAKVNQRTSISSLTTTQQEHPRMVRYNLPEDGTVEIYINQQNAAASSSFGNASLHGGVETMVVEVEPMSSTVLLQQNGKTNHERENKKTLGLADPLETRTCKAQYQWQLDSKITCNSMHEMDLGHFLDMKNKYGDYSDNNVLRERVRLIAGGGWRDVWGLLVDHFDHHQGDIGHSDEDEYDNTAEIDNENINLGIVVLKTLLYRKDVVPRNVERHRRDAMAMERLTSSRNIVDIYSFCGNSGIFQYANEGDLGNAVHTLDEAWRSSNGQWTREERLQRLHFGAYT